MATLIDNKKAHFNYDILETLEAGIELRGFEVKSAKRGQGSLEGSYIIASESGALLVNSFIAPYQTNNTPEGYEPRRKRRLLLTKNQLAQLAKTGNTKGLTIIPLSLYNKGVLVKVSLGIARSKKAFDKRQSIKKREDERHIDRVLKSSRDE
jgi:SsrA-binding protein